MRLFLQPGKARQYPAPVWRCRNANICVEKAHEETKHMKQNNSVTALPVKAFHLFQSQGTAKIKIICFSGIYGHAAQFRKWPSLLPDSVEILAFSWPRTLPDDYSRLLSALTQEVLPHLDRPYAIFGYSLGGILAFGLANALRDASLEPAALFLAATCAPSMERVLQSQVRELLRKALSEMVGPSTFEALYGEQEKSFWGAHCKACEPFLPFRCPLTAFGGKLDLMIPRQALEAWSRHTSGPFELQMFDGDHLFPFEQTAPLLESIMSTLKGSI